MARRKHKRTKQPPTEAPHNPTPAEEARLARLREEIRPELERIAAASRPQEPPVDPGEWRPTLRQRLRNYWKRKLNERRIRQALRRMDELMATPPAPPTSHRFALALERYHRHMQKLEKAVAEGRPKFLAQAELYLDDLRREVEAARVAADRWEDWARQAVLDQRDDLAKEALKVRDEWHQQADAWQGQLEELRRAI